MKNLLVKLSKVLKAKVVFVLVLSLLLFWCSNRGLLTPSLLKNVAVDLGRAVGYPGSGAIDMNLLVETISSALDYPTRQVPAKKDIIEMDRDRFSLLPQHFHSNFKSPCWYEEISSDVSRDPYQFNNYSSLFQHIRKTFEKMRTDFQNYLHVMNGKQYRLRCLPYFHIIGQQKCGTTDLYKRLLLHPHIDFGLMKEPNWWTTRGFNPRGFNHDGKRVLLQVPLKDYLDLYEPVVRLIQKDRAAAAQIVTGDATTNIINLNSVWNYYTRMKDTEPTFLTADFIHAFQPQAKILIMLRDPVERLYSDYLYFGKANESSENFHQRVVQSLKLFQSCLSKSSLRTCAYSKKLNDAMQVQLQDGMYIVFLRDWWSVFGRDQVLAVCLEDYTLDISAAVGKVLDFLGVDRFSQQQEELMLNSSRSNTRHEEDVAAGSMLPATRDLLRQFYQPFNQNLAAHTGNDVFLWSDESTTDV